MLHSPGVRLALGAAVFSASAFLGFHYRLSSASPLPEEPLPTEAQRRRVFSTKAASWDREVFLQELLLGIRRWRKQIVQQAQGDVLEVAAGTGLNFRYYDKKKVSSLTVTDFSRAMLQAAKDKAGIECKEEEYLNCCKHKELVIPSSSSFSSLGLRMVEREGKLNGIPTSFRIANACKLQEADEKYHSVVETFALCSYEDPVKTLKEVKRVLKKKAATSQMKQGLACLLVSEVSKRGKDGLLLMLEHGASSWPLINALLARGCSSHVKQFGCYANRPIMDLVEQAGLEVITAKRKNFGTTYMIVARKREEKEEEKGEPEEKKEQQHHQV